MRPPEVAARIVPGHWEGDLIKGANNQSSVGTLVERLSRYVMLVKLDGATADDILRGFNENANGLILEYLPKGTDLSQASAQQLTAIEHSLNNRPRKILKFHSPAEVFTQLTTDLIRGVALQV
jgi:IS30 family transposase